MLLWESQLGLKQQVVLPWTCHQWRRKQRKGSARETEHIEEEYRRITLKPLQSTFFGKLDKYTPKLLRLYRRTGGAVGKKLDETLEIMNEACTFKIVCDDDDAAAIQEAITSFVLDIFVVSKARDGGLEKQAGIAIEGAEVLAHACTLWALFMPWN
ncbi:unnamed protein product [Leuciscus chuanchicus]